MALTTTGWVAFVPEYLCLVNEDFDLEFEDAD